MIDFVKARLQDRSALEGLMTDKTKFPDVYASLNLHESTLGFPYKTKVNGMEFRLTESSAIIQNSLHIMNNELKLGESQNYNDFTYQDINGCLDNLEIAVSGVNDAVLTQLEFGFNIQTNSDPSQIIKENILMHNYRCHNLNKTFSGAGYLKRFDYTNYQVKIYDKSKQYRLSFPVLRFEVQIKRTPELHRLGVYQLKDLRDRENLNTLFTYTLNKFNDLLIMDSITDHCGIAPKERTQLEMYRSYVYWDQFQRSDRNAKSEHKKQFSNLLNKHSLLTTKNELRNALIEKYQELVN